VAVEDVEAGRLAPAAASKAIAAIAEAPPAPTSLFTLAAAAGAVALAVIFGVEHFHRADICQRQSRCQARTEGLNLLRCGRSSRWLISSRGCKGLDHTAFAQPHEGIRGIRDLKGKKVAFNGNQNPTYGLLAAMAAVAHRRALQYVARLRWEFAHATHFCGACVNRVSNLINPQPPRPPFPPVTGPTGGVTFGGRRPFGRRSLRACLGWTCSAPVQDQPRNRHSNNRQEAVATDVYARQHRNRGASVDRRNEARRVAYDEIERQ
jgi:hypothetical protein